MITFSLPLALSLSLSLSAVSLSLSLSRSLSFLPMGESAGSHIAYVEGADGGGGRRRDGERMPLQRRNRRDVEICILAGLVLSRERSEQRGVSRGCRECVLAVRLSLSLSCSLSLSLFLLALSASLVLS